MEIHYVRKRIRLNDTVGAIVAVAIGLFLVGHEAQAVYWSSQSDQWKTVSGKVVRSYRKGGKNRSAHVEYRYGVNGVSHTSKRIGFGGLLSSYVPFVYDRSKVVVGKYPTGKTVTVTYDPQKPSRSVLEPTYRLSGLVTLAVGFLFTGASVYSLMPNGKEPDGKDSLG